jgi:hypothetical protein
LKRTYPNFNELLGCIPDHRKRCTYQVAEIIMAGLSIFLFRHRSRNHADKNTRGNFETNFITLFGLRLPIMETVDKFLRKLSPEELEHMKLELMRGLLKRKSLERWKFKGRYIVAVDGTGLLSFDHEPFEGCPKKTSTKGNTTWTAYVVEAKLCCGNGFCVSLASVWLDNFEDISDKQDCEQKAFVRLAQKLKSRYPRLPIIITADSLYPNNTCFDICKTNGWKFIIVLKEGSLKSLWEEVGLLCPLQEKGNAQERVIKKDKKGWLEEYSMFVTGLVYKGHNLNWLEYKEMYSGEAPHCKFVHITNMEVNKKNAWEISKHGRMRWMIENQGFNTQKNGGYAMQHKYSRKYLWSMKNYYQLLQIAHLINQLTEKLLVMKKMIKESGFTIIAAIEEMISSMIRLIIESEEVSEIMEQTKQLRY